jgi:hypothetical protein
MIRRREDGTPFNGMTDLLTTTEAGRRLAAFGADLKDSFALVAAGVAP